MPVVAILILGFVGATARGASNGRAPAGALVGTFDGAWLSDDGLDLLQFDGPSLTWSVITPFGRIDPPNRFTRIGRDLSTWQQDGNKSWQLRIDRTEQDGDHALVRDWAALVPKRFTRLERLPVAARTLAPSDPATSFDVMASFVRAECPCLASRTVDWDRVVTTARAKIGDRTTPAELFETMTGALDAVDDAHFALDAGEVGSWMEPGSDGKRFDKENDLDRLRRVIDDRYAMLPFKRRCEGTICYGRMANLVGYVRIESFDRPGSALGLAPEKEAQRFVRDLDEIMRELDFVESLVLDLRFNSGGYASAVTEIASRFMKSRATLLTPLRRNDPNKLGALREGSLLVADAADHPRFLRRLLILTSHDTCSGGEVLPLALLGREPSATRIGEPTQGAFCGRITRRLPNDWRLTLTCVAFRSAKGESFEGRGLPPDVPVALFAGMDAKPPKDEALEKALELVGER